MTTGQEIIADKELRRDTVRRAGGSLKRVISPQCAFVGCGRKATKTKAVWSATIAYLYHVQVCKKHFCEPG